MSSTPLIRLFRLPVRWPRATLAALAAITLAAGVVASGVRIDSAIETLLPEHNEERRFVDEIHEEFGDEEITVVAVFADDVFAPATLAKVADLSTKFAAIDGVREVTSLATAPMIASTEAGLETGPLMPVPPATAEEAAALRARVFASPLYLGSLVGSDGRSTSLTIFYESIGGREILRRDIDGQIRALVARAEGPERLAVTGSPAFRAEAARLIQHDLAVFLPLSTLVIVAVLTFVFRSVRGVTMPLAMTTISLVWVVAFMVLTGSGITMGTLILPPLLIAEGTSYTIHMMSQYYQLVAPGRSSGELAEEVIEEVRIPLVVAALTTVLGFLTFVWSDIPAIREFGLYAAVGTFVLLVVSLSFVPATLTLLRPPRVVREGPAGPRWLTDLLEWLGRLSALHGRAVLAVFGVLAVVAIAGASRLRVETDYLSFFSPASTIRRDAAQIEEHLDGTQLFYVVLDTGTPRGLVRTEVLRGLRDLERHLDAHPEVDTTFSLLGQLGLVKSALGDGGPAEAPTTVNEVEQLLLVADPTYVRRVASDDLSRAVIVVRTSRTRLTGSTAVARFLQEVEDWGAAHLPRGATARVTGTSVLLNHSADVIAWGQVTGLAQMLATLLVLLSLMFLSVRIGALALIPNVFPIMMLFGIMGWCGISLNVSTSLIAAIALGIVVDDTFHYLTAFNVEARRTGSAEAAARKTLRTHGPAMVATAIALAAGYVIVGFSSFGPVRDFGYLASLTMLIGVVTDLFVTPALVQRVKIITVWDLVRLRLGPRPQDQVPLLAGLGRLGARVVVLMGRLASAPRGATLMRRGQDTPELYVLLDGTAEVRSDDGRVLSTLGRGDVVGEMGALRRKPRSADVVVTADAEYLVIDERFLGRLRRRYPRLAATVFLNLSRILSDRLERTTEALVGRVSPR